MKKLLKNPSGFTLVELMVVVSIIGILSAIAIPNFKKYQAKSKQSEAKIQLAAIYTAEVGGLSDYNTYGSCLVLMGYEQTQQGYYTVGFTTGLDASTKFPGCTAGAATAKDADALDDDKVIVPKKHLAVMEANKSADLVVATTSFASETDFLAAAEASISNNERDVWTINPAKNLDNSRPGF